MTPELQACVDAWRNEHDYNNAFHAELTQKVNAHELLKAHRDWTEAHQHGFGDRPFHWIWKLLVDEMPKAFSFLEIGVFKGQTVSLVALLAVESLKVARVYGVTTLQNTPDERCKYPAGDYLGWIKEIHAAFGMSLLLPELFVGKSSEASVVAMARKREPYQIVYVDGSHDYAAVIEDIRHYAPMVAKGGFLVMDDASNLLNIGSCWPGLEEVSQAVRDVLEPDPRFKHLLACGHLRVFQRIA